MAVSVFYGMTQSGKTTLAEKMLEKINRAILFDFTGKMSPKGSTIVEDFSTESILKVFSKFKDQKSFKIVFRPRGIAIEERFNKIACLALSLGKQAVKRGENERLVLLVDEADFVCTPQYQSAELKTVINVGRHDGVDSWMIARMPQRLHTDIRGNASSVFCFKLTDDSALSYIKKAVGKKPAEKIRMLEQYSFLAWKDNGDNLIFDKNLKLIESWR